MLMDSEEPELIVFLQESDYQIFKEICIDGEAPFHDKCCVENCELDHSILSGLLNSELEIRGNLTTEAPDVVSFVSNVSESYHQRECIMEVTKEFNSEVLLMESKVRVGARVKYAEVSSSKNLEAQSSVLFDSFLHRGEKENNQVPGDTILPTSMFSSSSKALHNDSCASESGFNGDADNGKTIDCDSFKSTVSCIEGSPEQDFAITENKAEAEDEIPGNFTKNSICLNDAGNSSYRAHPGSLAYTGPAPHSGSTSLRSNSSSASTRSFAFPILPSEWYDSPIRLADADGKNLRKRRQWRTRFICCNF